MIRLSRMADYAIVIAGTIAQNRDALHSAQSLASASGLGLPTVSKILKQLVKAGILLSIRGSHGGYRLAKSAETITIAQLIEAVDGPIALTECVEAHATGACHLESLCSTKSGWDKVNHAVRSALGSVTLAEFHQPVFLPAAPSLPLAV